MTFYQSFATVLRYGLYLEMDFASPCLDDKAKALHLPRLTLSSIVKLMQAAGDFIRPMSKPPSVRKSNIASHLPSYLPSSLSVVALKVFQCLSNEQRAAGRPRERLAFRLHRIS